MSELLKNNSFITYIGSPKFHSKIDINTVKLIVGATHEQKCSKSERKKNTISP